MSGYVPGVCGGVTLCWFLREYLFGFVLSAWCAWCMSLSANVCGERFGSSLRCCEVLSWGDLRVYTSRALFVFVVVLCLFFCILAGAAMLLLLLRYRVGLPMGKAS